MSPAGEVAGVFIGVGFLMLCSIFTYWFYQIASMTKAHASRENKIELLEELLIDKVAKKKGIDLDKETMKREIFKQSKKSMRRRLQDEIYDEMFGKDKEDKE